MASSNYQYKAKMVSFYMPKLILLRHGQSKWNEHNRFTGWVDISLSTKGIQEAQLAGEKLAHETIDLIYVSGLIRSQMTAMIVMSAHQGSGIACIMHEEGRMKEWGNCYDTDASKSIIPVICSEALNERYYGQLQGLNKQATMDKYGADLVQQWRRSYDTPPPAGESLKDTCQRTLPYFKEVIIPKLKEGKNVFICAHGNSLRSIIMNLDQLSEEQIVKLELSTGDPIIYDCYVTKESMAYQRL